MHILFIVNPISGLGLGKELPEKIRRIPEYDSIPYDIVFTEYAGHARKLVEDARQEGKYTHIVAVGGDGTVNEVGGALCGSDVAFGVMSPVLKNSSIPAEFIPSMMVFSLLGLLRKMVLLAVSLMEMGRIILLVLGDTSTWSLKKENFL